MCVWACVGLCCVSRRAAMCTCVYECYGILWIPEDNLQKVCSLLLQCCPRDQIQSAGMLIRTFTQIDISLALIHLSSRQGLSVVLACDHQGSICLSTSLGLGIEMHTTTIRFGCMYLQTQWKLLKQICFLDYYCHVEVTI